MPQVSGTEFKEAVSFELAEEELCDAQLTMASQNLGILSFAFTRIGREGDILMLW